MNLGDKIIAIRKENDLTQEKLAEMLHVTRQTVSNWENGKSYPDIATLVLISNVFKISLDDLLKDKKMITVIDKMVKKNTTLKLTIIILLLIVIILGGGLYIAKKYSLSIIDSKIFDDNITLEDITRDDGLIMSIRKINTKCNISIVLNIYNNGTYELYDTILIPEGKEINTNLIWSDVKKYTYDDDILNIVKNIKTINRREYEVQFGNGEIYMTTDDTDNRELMNFLNKYGIDLDKCVKAVKMNNMDDNDN